NIKWITSDDCKDDAAATLRGIDAVVIPGGFGGRGIEGKIAAITHARETKLPLLGLCLGLQCTVLEAARNVGIEGATSTEFDPQTPAPVIATMAEQQAAVSGKADLGGTMRLGAYPATLLEGSVVAGAYGVVEVSERHRHRYEVNNAFREQITSGSGLVFSGTSPDGQLVEFVEYPKEVHPYLVATQAHPEYKSRPTRPHPLFDGLVAAALGE
ncbi:MAG TPA: CTP synthase, partial [Actinomycetales bacterium]|nr:CTP synthase [Actinomycetales bacterium]